MTNLTRKETAALARSQAGKSRVYFKGTFNYGGFYYHNYVTGKGCLSSPYWDLPSKNKISIVYKNVNN